MIIVTGAAGFIGYQTAKHFKNLGKEVIGVDELLFFDSRSEHQDLKLDEKLAPEAILERSFYEGVYASGKKVEAIIHLGASSNTTEMRLDYLKRVNVDYSKTLWNYSCEFKIPFLYASSAATYGAGEEGYVDDESKMHLLKPLNPYGDSKLQFDLFVLEQEKLRLTPPIWSGYKFFNVYGYGEKHKEKQSSVVFQGFEQIRAHQKISLFRSHREGIADGEQKRDFVWVGDVVKVLDFALKSPIRRGIYNLGSGKARSFLDLAKATFSALQIDPQILFIDTPIAIRDRYQYFTEASMEKLRAAGYEAPFQSLEAGVRKTVDELASRSR